MEENPQETGPGYLQRLGLSRLEIELLQRLRDEENEHDLNEQDKLKEEQYTSSDRRNNPLSWKKG